MPEFTASDLDAVAAEILASAKYQSIFPEVIYDLIHQEAKKRSNLKELKKAVRTRLHQVGGAFINSKQNYTKWLQLLKCAREKGEVEFQNACLHMMRMHASTEERLPILPEFFQTCLESVSPVKSVLDLACGLNPLAISWMPLADDCIYYACDIFLDMLSFLDEYFVLTRTAGKTFGCNLTTAIPTQPAHVALLLKTVPLLDQTDKFLARKLLEEVPAEHVLISFPLVSLGGRNKGMQKTYRNRFETLIEGLDYSVHNFEFQHELAYLVTKSVDSK